MQGRTIGRYRVLEEIGRGGMGVVYRAEDDELGRSVALKALPPELVEDSRRVERLRREARSLAALNHPGILTVHDVLDENGQLFVATELVEGEDLSAAIPAGGLDLPSFLRLAIPLADAVAAAHEKGVVHRDLKPGNVRVTSEGRVKVLDFGLARLREEPAEGTESQLATLTRTAEGTVVGTPAYMAPEQIRGEVADERSDIFALGVILFEMATGRHPFGGSKRSSADLLSSILRDEPESVTVLRPELPPQLGRIVRHCLAKDPDRRFRSAAELRDDLAACQAALAASPPSLGVALRRPAVAAALAAVILASAGVIVWFWMQHSRAHWARTELLPEAIRLLDEGNNFAGIRLLRTAERYIPGDPLLDELLTSFTSLVTVRTTPPGAEVYVRAIFDEPDAWELLGHSPIESARLPSEKIVWKISHAGFKTTKGISLGQPHGDFSLQPVDAPEDMVHIPAGGYELFGSGLVAFEDYWIDRHEVTNRQFKEFIDQSGYEIGEYWREALVEGGAGLSWDEASRRFRDRTGRPAPATWELGKFPDGEDDYPVGGVSWFEAAAYCAWAGKHLPTVFHWYKAAALQYVRASVGFHNLAGTGPEPVGHPMRMGGYGTYDMVGNVKEWTWNHDGRGRRYILGAAWNEPIYQVYEPEAQHPFYREESHGFRCAKYREAPTNQLLAAIESPFRDYRLETPVGDETFGVYESLYRNDPLPLDPRVEFVDDQARYWRIEKVSFAAGYGNERIAALLFLPRGDPPYQAVVYFPGAAPFFQELRLAVANAETQWFSFLVRSGRAVLFPAYKGSFERHLGPPTLPHIWRDIVLHSAKDLGRAIEYLETREDIDTDSLAYVGWSMGAMAGPIMTSIEPRFRASILLKGGLWRLERPGESDPFNFLPRVKVPTLMVNGRHDFYFPYETSQVPMFDWLGTPPADTRHRVFDTGHVVTERAEVMRETLEWLDKYLGPVGGSS